MQTFSSLKMRCKNDPVYNSCKRTMRKMSARSVLFAACYLRSRYGLDLFAILAACKAYAVTKKKNGIS